MSRACQILQRGVIGDNSEFGATKVVAKLLAAVHNSKELAFGTAVLAFGVVATLASIRDHMVSCILMFLLEDSRNGNGGVVSRQRIRPVWLWQLQDRRCTQLGFQRVKRSLFIHTPLPQTRFL